MEESISGFKIRGGWNDAVEHGERITHALAELGVEGEAFSEWDEWRPKSHERLGEDVNEKTAEQASIEEGEGEKAGKEPNEDLLSAGEKLSESYDRLDDPDEAVDSWGESLDYVARAADSAGRKAVRTVEDTVYRNVMTQVAPYYFDNELVSANLQRSGRAREGDDVGYAFEVNVNDDDLKEQVSDRLAEYDDEVDRWHVDTPKNVEALEAAEGGEVPEETAVSDAESDVDFTTN
ncbi:DUF5828 family protein [Halococcus saccharolyticus]|uniref:Uncharacterized protein n=1 Tax=Halococcus saccharolyticus DSM 5350 TaxID=1227455 RepID=M0MHR1_9EURY|nr:DUF5828 family protein [Halococcus saccharolyticus]EMA44244.1 hypothetical protein C449_11978 [Halococcus saccharolyticus DSM 5350]